ncbi:hypothetical protein F9L07_16315 [Pimelobacter simplex]|uniref:Cupin domain-containing protein n=1 Tax=Nocardioides simplex TaxID=2045 RepID=A0A7J5E4Y9_NOCSI|nr:hypothetical protein [Pimelobacter simplex]KAB2813233.1 hypothetical protein F9L07_16315 [Pimelobacter simplex]
MKHNSDPGPIEKGPSDRFTGDVWLWPSVGQTTHADIRNVMFTPGSRSAWHCHPDGQVLHVTNGLGLVQNRGESPVSCAPETPSRASRANGTGMAPCPTPS